MLVLFLTVPAKALIPEEIETSAPEAARELWENLDDTADQNTLWNGASRLFEKAVEFCGENLKSIAGSVTGLLSAVFLSILAQECINASQHPTMVNYAPMAGVLAITLIAAGSVKSMMGLAAQTIEELDVFAKALLPTLAAATAAGGGVVSASARQVTTVVFSNLLLSLIHQVLMPMVYYYIAALAVDTVLSEHPLQGMASGIKKAVVWALTGTMTVFAGYLTISGAVASAGDALTMRVAKSAVSTAVPVVGSIISEAAGSVLASTLLLKNSVGIFGILGILAACLSPFLTIGIQYLLYKTASFVCGVIGRNELVEYIGHLGGAFGMMLGMVASSGLLLLLSTISSISAVMV